MKILWVKAGGLVPPDIGGKIRSYSILKELAKAHEVTVFNFYAAHQGDVHSGLNGRFEEVINLPLPIATNRGICELASWARNVFSSAPHTVSKYCRPEVKARMRELLANQKFDVIICDFVVAAAAIPWEIDCPKVMFTHNVEALIWKRHFEVSRNPLWKMASWGEYQKMIRFEKHFLNKSEHVLTVSEADKDFFSDFIDRSRMTVISTGVDTEYFRADSGNEKPNSLVFTGSMDWMPNEDGVLYFLRSVLPLVRREIPQVSFTVVGRKPSDKLRAAAASEMRVHVTGTVDDIRPYVREGAVYVVPLRIGSGTRLKIFEAMAMGKAIVSTTLGAEGLPITDGGDIAIADSPEEFSRKVCALLRDSGERRRLGSAARQLVEQHYSWLSVAAEFDAVLRRVAPVGNARDTKVPIDEVVSPARA
jgi:sugar transferase (PEP-CTERM/EpsH1 system associated)